MSNSKGKFRAPIYDYLLSRGFEMTNDDHEEIRKLLIAYVEAETSTLQYIKSNFDNHIRKCDLHTLRKTRLNQNRKNKFNNLVKS